MITKESETKKICSFYASEFHLEMIILPYINKELEKNKKIYIITEENLRNSIEVLISKINLEENRKQKILDLDWNNNYIDKLENIIKKSNEEEYTIIVNGREEFIKEVNKTIESKNNINIVNCYKIEEIQDHMKDIVQNHSEVLNTLGIKKINKNY